MASQPTPTPQTPNLDRYVVIHVATTCDEHGVYVTKDSAEVIELGWILLDAKSCEEVRRRPPPWPAIARLLTPSPAPPRERPRQAHQHAHHGPVQSVSTLPPSLLGPPQQH